MSDTTLLASNHSTSLHFVPPCPDDEMPEAEKERLFEELCARIDAGEFDPEREILI